jgi:hypothetical protein
MGITAATNMLQSSGAKFPATKWCVGIAQSSAFAQFRLGIAERFRCLGFGGICSRCLCLEGLQVCAFSR